MADKKKEEPVTPEKKNEKKEKGDEKEQELVTGSSFFLSAIFVDLTFTRITSKFIMKFNLMLIISSVLN
jgi:hypothetical protein